MVLTLLFFMQSCQSQPDTKSIDKCIRHYYAELSNQDGSGTYDISEIKVLEVKKINGKEGLGSKSNCIGNLSKWFIAY